MIHTATNPEFAQFLPLWTTVFQVPAEVFEGPWFGSEPEDRFIAWAEVDGQIVASVVVLFMTVRGLQGEHHKIGGLANVATRESARGQGHSSKLIAAAIEEMDRRQIAFSLLYTGVPAHYAKQGWVEFTDKRWEVVVSGVGGAQPDSSTPVAFAESSFPMRIVRSAEWTNRVVKPRAAQGKSWSSGDSSVVLRVHNDRAEVVEAWGEELAICLANAKGWCDSQSKPLTSLVPLGAGLTGSVVEAIKGPMVRPGTVGLAECLTLVQDPQAVFLPLDHF